MLDSIRNLIISNSTIEAMDEMTFLVQSIVNKNLYNNLVLQKARLNKIDDDYEGGYIERKTYLPEILLINKGLLGLLTEIESYIVDNLNGIDFPISNLTSKKIPVNETYKTKVVNDAKEEMLHISKEKYRTLIVWNIEGDTEENLEIGMNTSAYVIAQNCLNLIDDFPYFDIIWFINANNDDSIYEDLKALAILINFPISKNKIYFISDFKKLMETIDKTWLLIFLNVCDSNTQNWNTKQFENKYFPHTNLQKQILFTSNNWLDLKKGEEFMELNSKILKKSWRDFFVGLFFISIILGGTLFYLNIAKRINTSYKITENVPAKLPLIKTIAQFIYDDNNNEASIEIDILSKDFTWVKRETVSAEYVHEGKKINLRDYFIRQGYQKRINSSLDIICFGNSSFEEDSLLTNTNGLIREETRAFARAENLGAIIKEILTNDYSTLYTLNLGKNKTQLPKSVNSDFQRTIVIVRVLRKDKNINLKEALFKTFLKNKEMPFKISEYSKVISNDFDLKIYAKAISYQ